MPRGIIVNGQRVKHGRVQHEAIKGEVRDEVNSEIARHAHQLDSEDRAVAAAAGERLKQETMNEVVDTEVEIQRSRGVARVSQIIDYIFYLIYGIISLEIILDLLGARQGNTFREIVDTLAAPFLVPFVGLMNDPVMGSMKLRLSFIIALVAYLLLHLAITGLLRLVAQRKTTI